MRGMISLGSALPVLFLNAAPHEPIVTTGSAQISHESTTTHIKTSSDKTIINWDTFSIGAEEVVSFTQPSSSSAVLNKVTGDQASQIHGALLSNGSVYIVNPAGLFIGDKALIHVGSFFASTLDIAKESFLGGQDLFFSGDASTAIENRGSIKVDGGDVFLIAKKVENRGSIEAENGQVGLLAGGSVLLRPKNSRFLSIEMTPSNESTVDNCGVIEAAQVALESAGNCYGVAVNHSGSIRAKNVKEVDGRIFLVADAGKTRVEGSITSSGGEIHILGDGVSVEATAYIDVSSDTDAGQILIGGDFQGKNPLIQTAQFTTIQPGAVIDASSYGEGDGGRVIVWSDQVTRHAGTITACGGPHGGDGGFVEVSGKEGLCFITPVNLRAPNGNAGTLLLDPKNITIDSTGGTTLSGDRTFSDDPTDDETYLNTDVSTQINAGNLILQANTDIDIDNGFTTTSSNNLTLNAGRSITFAQDAAISLAGGDFTATINDAGATSNRDSGFASFTMGRDTKIETNGGNISITVGTLSPEEGNVVLINGGSNTTPGSFLTAAGGNITITGKGEIDAASAYGVNIDNLVTISTTGSGTIDITGTGGGGTTGTNDNVGLRLDSSNITISSENGDLTLTGTGGTRTGGVVSDLSYGIELAGATVRSTGSGDVILVGVGGQGDDGGSSDNAGVFITASAALVETTGTGNISITGTGGSVGDRNYSVYIKSDATVKTPSGGGNISITGNAAGDDDFAYGIYADANITSEGAGTITLLGTGGAGGAGGHDNFGVELGEECSITSVTGDISITGMAGGNQSINKGVHSQAGASVTSTGAAGVTIIGTGGTVSSTDYGVHLEGTGVNPTTISSAGGNVIIRGNSTGATEGVLISTNVSVTGTNAAGVTIESTTAGTVDFSGTLTTATGAATINSFSTITLNAGITTSGGSIVLGDATTLGAALTLTSGGGAITTAAVTSTNLDFTVNTGGGTGTIASVNVGTGDFISGGSSSTATITGALTADNIDVSSGGTVTVSGTSALVNIIDATSTGAIALNGAATITGSMTLDLNSMTFGAATHSLQGVTTSSSTALVLNGATLNAGANTLTFAGATTLGSGASTVNGGTITFSNTINSATNQNLTVTGSGVVSFSGVVGGSNVPGTFLITGSRIDISSNISAQALDFQSPVQMEGTSVLTATTSTANFADTIDSDGTARDLTVTASSGAVTFSGVIGGTNPLDALTVTGTTINAPSATTVSGGTLSYTGAVAISGASTTFTGTGTSTAVSFSSTITGNTPLTITASGSSATVVVSGAIDISGAATRDFTITCPNSTFTSVDTDNGDFVMGSSATVATLSGVLVASEIDISAGGTLTVNGTSTINDVVDAASLGALALNGAATISESMALDLNSITFGAATHSLQGISTSSSTALVLNGATLNAGTNTLTFAGATTLGSAASAVNGGTITFSSTINSSTNQDLTVTGSGVVTLSGVIGGSNPLGAFVVSGSSIALSQNITSQSYDIQSPVALSGSPTFTANTGAATFGSTINSVTSARDLTVSATGIATFSGVVGGTLELGALVVSGSSIDLSQNITAQSYNMQSPVTLSGSPTLTASAGAATFGGTINSVTSARDLTVSATGVTTFSGVVGGTLELGAFVASGSSIAISADVTSQSYNMQSPVTLSGASVMTASAGGATFGSSINSVTSVRDLTVSATGATVFSAAIGGSLELGAFVASGSSIDLSQDVTSQSYNMQSPVTLSGSPTLTASAGAATFGSTINSVTSARNLTVSATGVTTFSGVIGGSLEISSLVVSGSSIDVSADITAQSCNMQSPVTLSGAPTVTTSVGDATFGSTVNSVTSARDLTVSATGAATFSGVVGGTLELGALVVSGSSINLSQNVSSQSYNMQSPVTLSGSPTLTASSGAATFGSTINSDGTARDLTVSASSGTVTFTDNVGSTNALSSLDVTGSSINAAPNTTANGGTLTFTGPVVLDANSIFTDTGATGITFSSTITGNFDLTITASNAAAAVSVGSTIDTGSTGNADGGNVAITAGNTLTTASILTDASGSGSGGSVTLTSNNGTVTTSGITTSGASNGSAGGITVLSVGNATIGSTIRATGSGTGNGAAVSVTSTGGDVSVRAIDTSGGTTSGNAGNITLQPDSGFTTGGLGVGTVVPDGRLFLLGDLVASGGAAGTDGTISLSATGRTQLMSVATIASQITGNDVAITGGSLVVGDLEAITVLGDLIITLSGTSRVTDVVVLDTLTITTSALTVYAHEAANILNSSGVLYESDNSHLLAREAITVPSFTEVGPGPTPDSEQLTDYTRSQLEGFLKYSGYVLNFDLNFDPTPPAAAAATAVAAPLPVNPFMELFYILHRWDMPLPKYPENKEIQDKNVRKLLSL